MIEYVSYISLALVMAQQVLAFTGKPKRLTALAAANKLIDIIFANWGASKNDAKSEEVAPAAKAILKAKLLKELRK